MPDLIKGKVLLRNRDNSLGQAFTLHIISSGYATEDKFLQHITDLERGLARLGLGGRISPLTKRFSGVGDWLNIVTYFNAESTFSYGNTAPTFQGPNLDTWLDTANGKLVVNYNQFNNYLGKLYTRYDSNNHGFLGGNHSQLYDGMGNWPGAIVILIPNLLNDDYSLTIQQVADADMEHMPTATEPHYFAATTATNNYEQVVARAMGLCMGLGSEYDTPDADPASTSAVEPADEQGLVLDVSFFNLLYLPQELTPGSSLNANSVNNYRLQWYDLLGSDKIPNLPVHLHPDPSAMDVTFPPVGHEADIELWEGGGGFRKKIFRSAQDCIMRRKPGSRLLPVRTKRVPFCPACNAFMEKAGEGTILADNWYNRKDIHSQKLKIDEVKWHLESTYTKLTGVPALGPFNVPPKEIGLSGSLDSTANAFYTFDIQISPILGGLYFNNVKVNPQGNSHGGDAHSADPTLRDVMKEIVFSDLKIYWEGVPEPEIFSVAGALETGYNFRVTEAGERPGDNNFQRGFALELKQIFGNLEVEVTVVQSVVFRAPVSDFEGGGVAYGMKIFPQISFSWRTLQQGTPLRIERFEATVSFNVNTRHYMQHQDDGEMGDMSNHMSNYTSLFTDSNSTFDNIDARAGRDRLGRLFGVIDGIPANNELLISPVLPNWAALFDYVKTDITTQTTIKAVHGPDDERTKYESGLGHYRDIMFPYSSGFMRIKKVPRQGDYDNMHVHGYMGKHFEKDTGHFTNWEELPQDRLRVAAPFCGMDCLHTHWRWGELNERTAKNIALYATSNTRAQSFRGWSDRIKGAVAYVNMGGALIPPNQSLDVVIRNENPLIMSLSSDTKVVDHKFSVSKPSIGEEHVFFEFGTAWAIDFNKDTRNLFLTVFSFLGPIRAGSVYFIENIHSFYNDIYDEIRYFAVPEVTSLNNIDLWVVETKVPLQQRVPEGSTTYNNVALEQI